MSTDQDADVFGTTVPSSIAGFAFAKNWHRDSESEPEPVVDKDEAGVNPLRDYFESHTTGRGIWKWGHYFDVYDRFFKKFVGRKLGLLEIGIYSGGSLDMWRSYFGAGCQVYGVDVEDVCKVYESDGTKVFIGDQADREFWRLFRKQVPPLDIVIDDGGHRPEQQIVTLEEMLPYLRPGGIYLCEDIHRVHNKFSAYIGGLINHFNATTLQPAPDLTAIPTDFQRAIHAIHSYPFMLVIERSEVPVDRFIAPRRGTEWQPFLDGKRPTPAS